MIPPTLCLAYFCWEHLAPQCPEPHLFMLPHTHCHRLNGMSFTTLLWEKHGPRWNITYVDAESFQVTSIKGQQSTISKNIKITRKFVGGS